MGTTRWLAAVLLLVPLLAGYGGTVAAQPRSAQSDCGRELSRYGLTPIGWGQFRQLSNGWQVDVTARDNRGRTDGGTCMVFTSGQIRLYGFDNLGNSWGGGGGGSGAMTFNCASKDGRYRECQMPVNGRVELRQRWSDARCQEGYSWGVKRDRVWVNHGCRAEFAVYRSGGGGGGGFYPPGQSQSVQAQCRNEARRQGVDVSSVSTPRNMGSYWQATVYGRLRGSEVRGDCRVDARSNQATVFIKPGSGGSGGGQNDRLRAEQACNDQARRLGYKIVGTSAAQDASGGMRVAMQLKQGNNVFRASCFWNRRSGQASIEQVVPQPR